MSTKARSNPLSLAVLALLFERPMHPYEMAATLKHRRKHESIKLRYGSLYTVIDLLTSRGLIRAKETSRGGKRPERTVYALTPPGRELLREWLRDLIARPAKEFPQFEAALCLMPVLPPDEAVALLGERALKLRDKITQMESELAALSERTLAEMVEPGQELPAPLLGQKFPPLFVVETEYRLALLKAERDFVDDLVRRVTDHGWGPVGLWREIQAACENGYRNEIHESDAAARVTA